MPVTYLTFSVPRAPKAVVFGDAARADGDALGDL